MNRPADWQAALKRHWPIVTDAALDALEDEAMERWARSGKRDQFFANVITGLRSLRGEMNKYETAWSIVNDLHASRLLAEIAARDAAIECLTQPEEGRAAA